MKLSAVITQEECAEVIQAISKCIRFGKRNDTHDNLAHLEEEIGQLYCALDRLIDDWELDRDAIATHYENKLDTYQHWDKISNERVNHEMLFTKEQLKHTGLLDND